MVQMLKNPLLQNQWDFSETWYIALKIQANHSCSNYDAGLTLTYFMPRSNLVTFAFVWQKMENFNLQKLLQPLISKLVDALN